MSKSTFFRRSFFDTFKPYFWNIHESGTLKITELENVKFKAKLEFFSYVCIYRVTNVKVHFFFRRSFFDTFNHISGTYMGQEP